MTDYRQCSRPGCGNRAIATLRYNYAARTATVNPLEPGDDPHSWDLCDRHLSRLTVPEGWGLQRTEDPSPEVSVPVAAFAAPGIGTEDIGDIGEEDFTDEEMQALAAALEDGVGGVSDVSDTDPLTSAQRRPVSRVVRRTDIPQPSGHHPSRRNLPGRAPQRHLRAVHYDGE
ncbi:DUF3499 family protein [Corynebacterium glyciniphilum]|uniref:DUF3499 family protein n=1 Tax=Corynebacterium glyciniphilum TaxID=1404244 RepID=UPI0011AB39C6|nr:DUF3499 family protein [Corynebacterium glyciniphilum]MDN5683649.1 DUF3499 domain-containing protein [Corynebacterium glyciniphilum]